MNTTELNDDTPSEKSPTWRIDDAAHSIEAAWELIDVAGALTPAEIYALIGSLRLVHHQTGQLLQQLTSRTEALADRDDLVATDGGNAADMVRRCEAHLRTATANNESADTYLRLAHSAVSWVNVTPEASNE